MSSRRILLPLFLLFASGQGDLAAQARRPSPPAPKGIRVEDLTWLEAARVPDTGTVVVIPLGAEAKEHGPQLRLKNDFVLAAYYAPRILDASKVVVYPTVNYGFYPAFVEYPGSTTLRLETARDMIVDIIRTIARHGPRRFYVLNTGVSTIRALTPARDSLAASGIVMTFTDIDRGHHPHDRAARPQAILRAEHRCLDDPRADARSRFARGERHRDDFHRHRSWTSSARSRGTAPGDSTC